MGRGEMNFPCTGKSTLRAPSLPSPSPKRDHFVPWSHPVETGTCHRLGASQARSSHLQSTHYYVWNGGGTDGFASHCPGSLELACVASLSGRACW